jgi:hypothetical protein
MLTASGLIVRFLKVFEKGNYQSIKWVRYLTKASGSYQIRVGRRIILVTSCADSWQSFDAIIMRRNCWLLYYVLGQSC